MRLDDVALVRAAGERHSLSKLIRIVEEVWGHRVFAADRQGETEKVIVQLIVVDCQRLFLANWKSNNDKPVSGLRRQAWG